MIGFVAKSITYHFNQSPDNLFKKGVRKVTYEEHEYLIYNDRGVCHYPECKCKTKGEAK
jgi:hypothetical protein